MIDAAHHFRMETHFDSMLARRGCRIGQIFVCHGRVLRNSEDEHYDLLCYPFHGDYATLKKIIGGLLAEALAMDSVSWEIEACKTSMNYVVKGHYTNFVITGIQLDGKAEFMRQLRNVDLEALLVKAHLAQDSAHWSYGPRFLLAESLVPIGQITT